MKKEITQMRLDKWLWAARFYKTRKLSALAVQGGKVHLNGQRCKAGKTIKAGSQLEIHKDHFVWNITIEQIPKQRRPAIEAITFYSESEQSQQKRQNQAALIRAERAARPKTDQRPNKKERRHIHRFKESF